MITLKQRGNFDKLTSFLERIKEPFNMGILNKYGMKGVDALREATPKDTGKTSESWSYKITRENDIVKLSFLNSNRNQDVPIAIILQYGHGTKNGGWVEGIDYINPAIQPLFEELAKEIWKEVSK
jgi:hypothetical protein|nr:MAG TPA: type I neck protein [Caudoviricetes sp.]